MHRHARFRLIIFNIEKNNNVGLLTRSAYAFGCDEVILVGKTKIRQTGSAGTYLKQTRRHFYGLAEAVQYCREEGFLILGVEVGGTPVSSYPFVRDVAFILGNEGRGLADAEPFCDDIVTIPQWGGVPSLNVSTAGAIAMYSFACQQDKPHAQSHGQKFFDCNFPISSELNQTIKT